MSDFLHPGTYTGSIDSELFDRRSASEPIRPKRQKPNHIPSVASSARAGPLLCLLQQGNPRRHLRCQRLLSFVRQICDLECNELCLLCCEYVHGPAFSSPLFFSPCTLSVSADENIAVDIRLGCTHFPTVRTRPNGQGGGLELLEMDANWTAPSANESVALVVQNVSIQAVPPAQTSGIFDPNLTNRRRMRSS